jgi:ADP-heptose:LPS heptosyltransferase
MQRGRSRNRRLDYWVGIPLLYLLASFFRLRRLPGQIRKIGVLCSAALGDTLLFSGALQDLRAAYPGARITHLCTAQNIAAAEIIPGADERVLISFTDPVASLKTIRAQHFDMMLDFTTWPRLTAIYTLLSGAAYTVGFRTPGQYRSRGYDRTFEHRADVHEVVNLRALVQVADDPREQRALAPGPDEIKAGGTTHDPAIIVKPVRVVPFSEEPDVVVLHLWASGQRSWLREWPEERWVQLALRLATPETLFVISGALYDRPRMDAFVERMLAAGLRAVAFVSPDGLHTLTHILRHARIVVTVNTGVMHLAAIAGAYVVAINGPNRNGRWGPVGPHAVGVEAPGDGCGYLHLGFNFDGHPTDCMERTTVDQVYSAAQHLLAVTAAGVR